MLTALLLTTLFAGTEFALPEMGTVRGHVLYPSCMGPPADLEICAENVETGQKHCTRRVYFETGRVAYQLNLPKGKFHVYGESAETGHRGYFSEHVTCGLSIDCQDHAPIEVTVDLYETVSEVDVADWVLEEAVQ